MSAQNQNSSPSAEARLGAPITPSQESMPPPPQITPTDFRYTKGPAHNSFASGHSVHSTPTRAGEENGPARKATISPFVGKNNPNPTNQAQQQFQSNRPQPFQPAAYRQIQSHAQSRPNAASGSSRMETNPTEKCDNGMQPSAANPFTRTSSVMNSNMTQATAPLAQVGQPTNSRDSAQIFSTDQISTRSTRSDNMEPEADSAAHIHSSTWATNNLGDRPNSAATAHSNRAERQIAENSTSRPKAENRRIRNAVDQQQTHSKSHKSSKKSHSRASRESTDQLTKASTSGATKKRKSATSAEKDTKKSRKSTSDRDTPDTLRDTTLEADDEVFVHEHAQRKKRKEYSAPSDSADSLMENLIQQCDQHKKLVIDGLQLRQKSEELSKVSQDRDKWQEKFSLQAAKIPQLTNEFEQTKDGLKAWQASLFQFQIEIRKTKEEAPKLATTCEELKSELGDREKEMTQIRQGVFSLAEEQKLKVESVHEVNQQLRTELEKKTGELAEAQSHCRELSLSRDDFAQEWKRAQVKVEEGEKSARRELEIRLIAEQTIEKYDAVVKEQNESKKIWQEKVQKAEESAKENERKLEELKKSSEIQIEVYKTKCEEAEANLEKAITESSAKQKEAKRQANTQRDRIVARERDLGAQQAAYEEAQQKSEEFFAQQTELADALQKLEAAEAQISEWKRKFQESEKVTLKAGSEAVELNEQLKRVLQEKEVIEAEVNASIDKVYAERQDEISQLQKNLTELENERNEQKIYVARLEKQLRKEKSQAARIPPQDENETEPVTQNSPIQTSAAKEGARVTRGNSAGKGKISTGKTETENSVGTPVPVAKPRGRKPIRRAINNDSDEE